MNRLRESLTHIAETSTDKSGYYSLDHDSTLDSRLRIRVSIIEKSGRHLSRIVLSPITEQRVDFVINGIPHAAQPLHAQIERKLANVLGDLKLQELDEVGIARASLSAGLPPRLVTLAREAARGEELTGLQPSVLFCTGNGRNWSRSRGDPEVP